MRFSGTRWAWTAPAALVLALWIYWAQELGGYFPKTWYPSTIGAIALLAVTAVATRRVMPAARVVRLPLLAFAALVLWSYLGILWSVSPGAALDSANQLALYLACAWILSLLPWTGPRARLFLGAWVVGLCAIAAVSLARATGAVDFSPYLFELRYQDPVGYANGNAALGLAAAWPALMLASRRRAGPVGGALFLGAAVLLVDFAALSQSRGSMIGAALAVVAMLCLAPERLSLLSRVIAGAAAVAVAIGPILNVYETGSEGGALGPALDHAIGWIVVSVAVAAALGALLWVASRTLEERAALRRRSGHAALAAAAVIVLAAIGVAAANAGRIADRVDTEISTVGGAETDVPERTRAASLNPYERPDYWRVALEMFSQSPLAGTGTGSFEHEYTARRDDAKHSRFAHDVYLRFLGEEGLVGALLLLGFLGLIVVLAIRARRSPGAETWVLAATVATMVYVFAHASLDWLDELPAVFAPAVALPLVGLAAVGREARAWVDGRAVRAAAALALAAALVFTVPPWLSLRFVERAERNAAADPSQAFVDLGRAHDLNPLSLSPPLTEARIAIEYGRDRRAREALQRAVEIEDNWYSHFELAMLDTEAGDFAAARHEIARARELSASDPVLARFERAIRARRTLDAATVNRELSNAVSTRFTATPR